MLFSSLVFIFFFLPTVIIVYYFTNRKLRNLILLLFSLFFYAYGEPKYLLVMIISITANYLLGLLVHRYRHNKIKAKWIVAIAVIINLSIIGYFKYTNFLLENINLIFNKSLTALEIVMPIGISFFTFQGLSYVIDIYRNNGKIQKNPINVALYISLFPQLIAGPIVRYETVADQLVDRKESVKDFSYGVERFILGLGKKVLIANTVGSIADKLFSMQIDELSVLLAWIGILAYTAQIYFDFSGYSDMAIGLGRMFGFKFLENFNYPYISRSITEFWRRWHISLSTWFKDYVYIPLGGNRVNTAKFIRNIIIVWLLTGLWHGAAWNFIAWGGYYGLLLIIEKLFLSKYINKLWRPFQHIYTLFFVVLGWLLFRSETIEYAIDYFSVMIGISGQPIINFQALYYLLEFKFELIIAVIATTPIYPIIKSKIEGISVNWLKGLITDYIKPILIMGVLIMSVMYLVNSTFNPFIYFRF